MFSCAMRNDEARPVASAALVALFADRLPAAAYELIGEGDDAWLYEEEAAVVESARAVRRREFAAGRACARRALAKLGLASGALPRLPSGSAAWPPGAIGSISHTANYCCAVAARSDTGRLALGIDVERMAAVTPGLHSLLFAAPERAWLTTLNRHDQPIAATLAFSAKEAFYKAQHPLTAAWLDFLDVVVRPAPGGFDVTPARKAAAALTIEWPVRVRSAELGDYVVTGALVRAVIGGT